MRKSVKSDRYKYVIYDPDGVYIFQRERTLAAIKSASSLPWIARPAFVKGFDGALCRTNSSKRFATEREAALFVDKWFLSHGREPVNILVRKP